MATSVSIPLLDVISNEIKQWATASNVRLSFLDFCTKLGPIMQHSEYAGISAVMLTNTVNITEDLLATFGLVESTATATAHAKHKLVQLLEEQPALFYRAIPANATLPFHVVTDATTFQTLLHRIGSVQAKNVLKQISKYRKITQATYHNYVRVFDVAHGIRSADIYSSSEFALSPPASDSSHLLHQTTTQLLDVVSTLKRELDEHRSSSEREREMAATERFMNMQRWEVLFSHLLELLASIRGSDDAAPLDLCIKVPAEYQGSEKTNNCSIGLFATPTPGDWYVMCRQEVGWQKAKRTLLERNVQECYKWERVIASKREFTILLARNICSDKWLWLPRLNILRFTGTPLPTDEAIIDMITPLLYS